MLVVITGEAGCGKTRLCEKLVAGLRARDLACAGILTKPAKGDEALNRKIVDIATGDERPLTAGLSAKGTVPVGPVGYLKSTIDWANAAIDRAKSSCDVLVVDELGALEMERNEGLTHALTAASEAKAAVYVVRPGLVSAALARIGAGVTPVLTLTEPPTDDHVIELERALGL